MILSQQKLIHQLRDHDIRVSSTTIHAWVRSGCPTVPGWKNPKFILVKVLDWIQTAHQVDPLVIDVRDTLYKRRLKKSA
jgi:hypothetical protein